MRTLEGERIHAILWAYETSLIRLSGRGLERRTAARISLFLALTTEGGWKISEAWEDVNRLLPKETQP